MTDRYQLASTKLVSAKLAFEKKPTDIQIGITALKAALAELTTLGETKLTSSLRVLILSIENSKNFTSEHATLLGQLIAAVFTKMKLDTSLNRAMDSFQKNTPQSGDDDRTLPTGNKQPPKK